MQLLATPLVLPSCERVDQIGVWDAYFLPASGAKTAWIEKN
jgi:hypothetical protein